MDRAAVPWQRSAGFDLNRRDEPLISDRTEGRFTRFTSSATHGGAVGALPGTSTFRVARAPYRSDHGASEDTSTAGRSVNFGGSVHPSNRGMISSRRRRCFAMWRKDRFGCLPGFPCRGPRSPASSDPRSDVDGRVRPIGPEAVGGAARHSGSRTRNWIRHTDMIDNFVILITHLAFVYVIVCYLRRAEKSEHEND